MARSKKGDLVDALRARGLRKKVAERAADAIGSRPRKRQPSAVTRVIDDLKGLAEEIEDRATGRSAKRKAAARKAAQTRKRKARSRSRAAKKGAATRAKAKAR